MKVNALILAAGLGSRLMPLTRCWPKCLMPIHGKPIMEYWLSELFKANVKSIFVNTCHFSEIVGDYLNRERFREKVKIVKEEKLLGTAGTIKKLHKSLSNLPVLIIHGDNWCDFDISVFIDQHLNHRPSFCCITMLTFHSSNPKSCGIVEVDEDLVVRDFEEKPSNPKGNLANGALYLVEPEVIKWISDNNVVDFSIDVLPHFVGKIYTVYNKGVHRDIGTIEGLIEANSDPEKAIIWKENDFWLSQFSLESIHQLLKNRNEYLNEK